MENTDGSQIKNIIINSFKLILQDVFLQISTDYDIEYNNLKEYITNNQILNTLFDEQKIVRKISKSDAKKNTKEIEINVHEIINDNDDIFYMSDTNIYNSDNINMGKYYIENDTIILNHIKYDKNMNILID